MNKLIFIFAAIILINFISAECNETQVDINVATVEELDLIVHVGNVTAWKIINLRPYISVDELEKVSGISAGYVSDIKTQGLACVDESTIPESANEQNDDENSSQSVENSEDEETPIENSEANETLNKQVSITADVVDNSEEEQKETAPQVIKLNQNADTQDIKSENSFWNLRDNYALISLIVFSAIIAFLLVLKNKTRKSELV